MGKKEFVYRSYVLVFFVICSHILSRYSVIKYIRVFLIFKKNPFIFH